MKKNEINLEFFSLPKHKIINKFYLRNYSHDKLDLYCDDLCIYVTPNISVIDKYLVTSCINTKFVFINDTVIKSINDGSIKEKTLEKLLSEIKLLSENGFVFSLIWNQSPSLFGDHESISENLSYFLYRTKLDVKFLTFPNLYFAHPIWADHVRSTRIFSSQTITIKNRMLVGYSNKHIYEIFKNATPSSASTYSNKYPTLIKSDKRAVGLERIMYCCPNCEKLCSMYSEYSCIKCKDCGSAFEINNDGKILFSRKISNFDELHNFQFNALKRSNFTINTITSYDQITQIFPEKNKKIVKIGVNMQIYADKLVVINSLTKKSTEIHFEDVVDISLNHNNHLTLNLKNAKKFYFQGKNNENFLIIKDLISINKN